jgi:CHASE2 domain-containing sensor protein
MTGKMVILGGDYAVQDEHDTPLGWRLGVEILAQTIETELEGGGLPVPCKIEVIFIAILVSVALWLLLLIWQPRKLVLFGFCCIVIPVLAFICSLVAFRSVAQWGYFLPILVAVLIHQAREQLKESSVEEQVNR